MDETSSFKGECFSHSPLLFPELVIGCFLKHSKTCVTMLQYLLHRLTGSLASQQASALSSTSVFSCGRSHYPHAYRSCNRFTRACIVHHSVVCCQHGQETNKYSHERYSERACRAACRTARHQPIGCVRVSNQNIGKARRDTGKRCEISTPLTTFFYKINLCCLTPIVALPLPQLRVYSCGQGRCGWDQQACAELSILLRSVAAIP